MGLFVFRLAGDAGRIHHNDGGIPYGRFGGRIVTALRTTLPYRLPEEVFGPADSGVRGVKRAAARLGRLFVRPGAVPARRRARHRLATLLAAESTPRLRYWCVVLMIDDRWCGATGAGAYWAVASREVNELARAELRLRVEQYQRAADAQRHPLYMSRSATPQPWD